MEHAFCQLCEDLKSGVGVCQSSCYFVVVSTKSVETNQDLSVKVISKRHVSDIAFLSAEEWADLKLALQRARWHLQHNFQSSKSSNYTISIDCKGDLKPSASHLAIGIISHSDENKRLLC